MEMKIGKGKRYCGVAERGAPHRRTQIRGQDIVGERDNMQRESVEETDKKPALLRVGVSRTPTIIRYSKR